jgi:hypothetical protein
MIILEKPYVSDFLQQTVVDLQVPVLETEFSKSLKLASQMRMMDGDSFFNLLNNAENPLLYSNSENSSDHLLAHCPDLRFTRNVQFFKNKARFREVFAALNPDVWYRTFTLSELDRLDIDSLSKPFVIKPVRGHASVGIHAIYENGDWIPALASIHREVELMRNIFPDSVISLNEYLIERYIEGTEIAIDAYFDKHGEPVILNILIHLFGSKSDMSDRLYFTSDEIIRKYHAPIMNYLKAISALADFRSFPFHLEMRQEPNGNFAPMEINPMRFMGFCVADVEHYFYGINPYQYYFEQRKPDWDAILSSRSDKIYGMFGIDIPKHLDKSRIVFNYDKFIGHFSHPLHYAKMDYTRFPMAIYLFAETTKDNFAEFEEILLSDLSEFIDFVE